MKGNIIDIRRFTIHDGHGIRSTVFFKGCPLRCEWCQNPEGIGKEIELWYFESKCIQCHSCLNVCQNNALSSQTGHPHIVIDKEKCTNMGQCVEVCPTGALCFDGKTITHEEVVEELLKDLPFYQQSGGGITLSGGEPLYQPELALEILKLCKEHNLHTAVETCLYYKKKTLQLVLDYVDLFYVDIKLYDDSEHKKYTGAGNEIIKDNFKFLASTDKEIIVRIPMIPGITANKENIGRIAEFVWDTNKNIPIELMNYNPLAQNKYVLMGKDNPAIKDMKPLEESELDEFYDLLQVVGIKVIRETKI